MKLFNQILHYTIFSLIAILLGICSILLLSGGFFMFSGKQWWQVILNRFYQIGMLQVGFYMGCITSVLYVLLDILYLRVKLKSSNTNIIRFLYLLGITLLLSLLYYVL